MGTGFQFLILSGELRCVWFYCSSLIFEMFVGQGDGTLHLIEEGTDSFTALDWKEFLCCIQKMMLILLPAVIYSWTALNWKKFLCFIQIMMIICFLLIILKDSIFKALNVEDEEISSKLNSGNQGEEQ